MTRRLISLLRDRRGSSVIELAIAAPIFGAFIIGMVDLSRAYSAKLQLEQAAQRTIEYVQRNGYQPGDDSTLQAEAAAAAGVATSAVTVNKWLECYSGTTTITKTYTGQTCSAGQSYARYISVDITKTYAPIFRVKWDMKTASSIYTLHGKAGLRVQ
jgi:Flp pilus assembly protein TadG